MRDFFKQELKTLKAKTGLNQYETFSNMPDAEVQLKALFDGLVSVCAGFNYIPNEDKKNIIQTGIITDPDFTGLNARIVFKWLQAKNSLYFKEEAHKPIESTEKPIPYDSPEREAWLRRWEESLKLRESKFIVPELNPDEIQEEGQERPKKNDVKTPDQEYIQTMALIRRIAYKKYIGIDYSKFQNFIVEGFKIFCASQEDAHDIYIEALTLNELNK